MHLIRNNLLRWFLIMLAGVGTLCADTHATSNTREFREQASYIVDRLATHATFNESTSAIVPLHSLTSRDRATYEEARLRLSLPMDRAGIPVTSEPREHVLLEEITYYKNGTINVDSVLYAARFLKISAVFLSVLPMQPRIRQFSSKHWM